MSAPGWLRLAVGKLLLTLVSLFAALILSEIGLRFYQWVTLNAPLGNEGLYVSDDSERQPDLPNLLDKRLGWSPTEGYEKKGLGEREDGSRYPLHVAQGRHGFRRYGSGTGPRALVVGDSYTQALDVSDERTYYALLEREAGLEMYAIGSSGYGTLQESLLIDAYFDEVKPDLVILQFCYNDFMNNSYALESAWDAGNCDLHERPYLDGDAIRFRLPGRAERLRSWAQHSTRLYEFVAGRLARLRGASPDLLVQEIVAAGAQHTGFRESAAITDRIFDRIAAKVGATPVIVFELCTTSAPFHATVEELARRHHWEFVPELPGSLDGAEQAGQLLLASDHVHWNEEAQPLIASALAPHVRAVLERRHADAAR